MALYLGRDCKKYPASIHSSLFLAGTAACPSRRKLSFAVGWVVTVREGASACPKTTMRSLEKIAADSLSDAPMHVVSSARKQKTALHDLKI